MVGRDKKKRGIRVGTMRQLGQLGPGRKQSNAKNNRGQGEGTYTADGV